jgi:predicted TIM-barrel fold metal-dependent hydrolase
MSIKNTLAIDVHGHYGAYVGTGDHRRHEFMSASIDEVIRRAKESSIAMTVVSPLQALLPRNNGDALAGNKDAFEEVPRHPELRQLVVVNPLEPETFDQARRMLKSPHCLGIKIHPEEHGYPIVEHGQKLFEFAAEAATIVLTHSGEANSLPEDFVPFANQFEEVQLILAHFGSGIDDDPSHHARAIQASKHGNIFSDTSSASSLLPGLIEWGVREVGAERILFGTDTPVYVAAMHRARIDCAELSDHEKRCVLRDNAVKLFGLYDINEDALQAVAGKANSLVERTIHDLAEQPASESYRRIVAPTQGTSSAD